MKLPKTLKDISFEYAQGFRFKSGAERVYVNKKHGIQINIETPFNEKTNEWGAGKKSYSLISSANKKFFDSYTELYSWLQEQDK